LNRLVGYWIYRLSLLCSIQIPISQASRTVFYLIGTNTE
jgi:hypothetical protein